MEQIDFYRIGLNLFNRQVAQKLHVIRFSLYHSMLPGDDLQRELLRMQGKVDLMDRGLLDFMDIGETISMLGLWSCKS